MLYKCFFVFSFCIVLCLLGSLYSPTYGLETKRSFKYIYILYIFFQLNKLHAVLFLALQSAYSSRFTYTVSLLQIQTAVTAYLKSKQLLLLVFARYITWCVPWRRGSRCCRCCFCFSYPEWIFFASHPRQIFPEEFAVCFSDQLLWNTALVDWYIIPNVYCFLTVQSYILTQCSANEAV